MIGAFLSALHLHCAQSLRLWSDASLVESMSFALQYFALNLENLTAVAFRNLGRMFRDGDENLKREAKKEGGEDRGDSGSPK